MAGDGRDSRCINSKCVHAAAGRDGHGRFERRRWEQEENEHLKLEKVDVPDGRRTLKIGALVQALDGTKGFPMTDGALEAGLKVPSNLVLGVIGQLLPSILSSHCCKSYPANRLHILSAWCVSKLARPSCDCTAPTSGTSVG